MRIRHEILTAAAIAISLVGCGDSTPSQEQRADAGPTGPVTEEEAKAYLKEFCERHVACDPDFTRHSDACYRANSAYEAAPSFDYIDENDGDGCGRAELNYLSCTLREGECHDGVYPYFETDADGCPLEQWVRTNCGDRGSNSR